MTIKIGLLGISGKMGQSILQLASEKDGYNIIGGTTRQKSDSYKGFLLTEDPESIFMLADVLVDFTSPFILENHLRHAIQTKKPIVIGTTGLSEPQMGLMQETSKHVPLLYATNMSLGITLLLNLIEEAAKKLDTCFDIEILEKHHNLKKDAPSGTALSLGKAAQTGRKKGEFVMHWTDHEKRQEGQIGFAVQRGGTISGEHIVSFYGPDELIEFRHQASSRRIFAQGALKAASWIKGQKPGLYSMKDVLNLA